MIKYVLGRYLLSLDWGTGDWKAWGISEFPVSNLNSIEGYNHVSGR